MHTTLPLLAGTLSLVALAATQAGTVSHDLSEFQTISWNDAGAGGPYFPAANTSYDNNVAKFDLDDQGNNTVAPFTTTAYVRTSNSTNSARFGRRVQLYLQFDLSGLTAESITTATLEFSAYSLNDQNNNNADLFVSQVADDWAPAGTPDPVWDPAIVGTAINAGSVVSGTETDVTSGTPNGTGYRNITPYTIDVTSIVQNWQGGAANHGFHLKLNDSATQNNGIGIDLGSLVLKVVTPDSVSPEIKISDITRAANGDVTLNITSPEGNVDVYRSPDLQAWGSPIDTDVAPGSYTDTTSSDSAAFYILAPTGDPAP